MAGVDPFRYTTYVVYLQNMCAAVQSKTDWMKLWMAKFFGFNSVV